MEVHSRNSKKIIKNTLFLYMRMGILMTISLFTSRIILKVLGVEDFGVYNVVGGVTVLFGFMSSSLTNASQRFLTIEIGKEDIKRASQIFNQHLVLYCLIIFIVLCLSETIGLWFVHNKLVIPEGREFAAFYIYQFTVLSLCLTLFGIVFSSSIIAHEDMNIYAFVGICEGIVRLAVVYILYIIQCDKLIMYGLLLMLLTASIQIFNIVYCYKKYKECRFFFIWDKSIIRETCIVGGWNMLGTSVYAINDSGINILLNLFFGPVVNAARAISFQVSGAVNAFASNFLTSVRPQITKSYAARDYQYLMNLFYNSSKYSFLLLWIPFLPIAFYSKEILNLWLDNVPEQADLFTVWVLIYSLVCSLNNPIWTIALSTGKLKKYILIGSAILLLVFPFSYCGLQLGMPAIFVFRVLVIFRVLHLSVVLKIIKAYVPLSGKEYFSKVVIPLFRVAAITTLFSYVLRLFMKHSSIYIFLYFIIVLLFVIISIWFLALSVSEKELLLNFIKSKLHANKEKEVHNS